MHMATIGLFGKHICNSIVYKISNTLRNDVLIKELTEDGSPRYIISEAALENVYDSLCKRLQHFHRSHAGFQLTSKYTVHFKRVFLTGTGTFTAGRMVSLMPAIIFVLLHDLLKPEIKIIFSRELPNVAGRARILSNLKDPWKDMVEALSSFLDWFIKPRSMLFPMDDAPELQKLARSMKRLLQLNFPKNLAKSLLLRGIFQRCTDQTTLQVRCCRLLPLRLQRRRFLRQDISPM